MFDPDRIPSFSTFLHQAPLQRSLKRAEAARRPRMEGERIGYGDLRVWSAASGALLQTVAGAHERHTFLAPRGGGRNVLQVGVAKIVPLDGGALTCGGDGTVKLFRLAPDARERRAERVP